MKKKLRVPYNNLIVSEIHNSFTHLILFLTEFEVFTMSNLFNTSAAIFLEPCIQIRSGHYP